MSLGQPIHEIESTLKPQVTGIPISDLYLYNYFYPNGLGMNYVIYQQLAPNESDHETA